jgi:hypothetical protein
MKDRKAAHGRGKGNISSNGTGEREERRLCLCQIIHLSAGFERWFRT